MRPAAPRRQARVAAAERTFSAAGASTSPIDLLLTTMLPELMSLSSCRQQSHRMSQKDRCWLHGTV